MNLLFLKKTSIISASLSIVGILATATLPLAMSENVIAGDAKVLMDEAKKDQANRKQAAMQKELDRLSEDAKKAKQEMDHLEKSMSKVSNAVAGAKSQIDQLAGRKNRVIQDLELLPLRMEAERLKAEALTLLNSAHAKEIDALTRRNEELDLKIALTTAEMQRSSASDADTWPDSQKGKSEAGGVIRELRKNLEKAHEKSSVADSRAHEAMDMASRKLQQADAAAVKAEKKQAEIDRANDPNAPAVTESPKSRSIRAR
ncbi:MAG: hypothetical protein ABIP85_08660 [Chthoniobacteraceae bacterium]